MVSICLSMIVRNEAAVIARCLRSVLPIIDTWCIVDTGSTDDTKAVILETMKGIRGELRTRPWVDFAHNRSEALALARHCAGYTLVIDADDVLAIPPDFVMPDLTADSYEVDFTDTGSLTYRRTAVVRNLIPWHYRGVLHEFIECPSATTVGHLPLTIERGHDGARRRDPETYRRDAKILLKALRGETDPFMRARYTFYLAQSWRDCGDKIQAIRFYLERAKMGFWQDEVFVSLLYAARMREDLGQSPEAVMSAYANARRAADYRAEAAHAIARFCRMNSRNQEGYEIAKRALHIQQPAGGLFVEPWIYQYGLLDEFAVNAYWSEHYQEAADANRKLLAQPGGTPGDRDRWVKNLEFSERKLPDVAPQGMIYVSNGPVPTPSATVATLSRILHKSDAPRILLAILAKQKADTLPLYLECIEALDYPKSSIVLSVRTNNNTDATPKILEAWLARVGHLYADVEYDDSDVPETVEKFAPHEWNATRLSVIRRLRNISIGRAKARECAFYFVVDCDNFIAPETLSELVSLNLPIVAPMLRLVDKNRAYSNLHVAVDDNGYYKDCEEYYWIINRRVVGVIEVPVVHCTYLVRADVIDQLTYEDGAGRYDYVTFSHSARRAGVPQYFDNRKTYGYLVFDPSSELHIPGALGVARKLMGR